MPPHEREGATAWWQPGGTRLPQLRFFEHAPLRRAQRRPQHALQQAAHLGQVGLLRQRAHLVRQAQLGRPASTAAAVPVEQRADLAAQQDESIGWHFTERKMKPKLLGDLSRHLKYDYSAP